YPAQGEILPDSADFVRYNFDSISVEDWRRHNVDLLVSQVSQMIKTLAPHVKFGVSPFGVWRNISKDPELGSATRAGVNTYDDLYADVRGWLAKGWIDYVAPQLYWNIGFAPADYEILVDWWRRNAFDKHVYIGQAAYKVDSGNEGPWKNPVEIPRQIRLNRQTAGVGGSIFYNTSSLRKNPLGVLDSLRNQYFSAPALPPEMAYLNIPQPNAPKLGKPNFKAGKLTLPMSVSRSEKNAAYLVVYRFEDRLPGDFNNPHNIFALIPMGNGTTSVSVEDANLEEGKIYTYVASAVNRQHTESNLSERRTVQVSKNKLKVLK
ncbi:MAG: family 10 glycosylhydrolase, partial [Bacteroidota bacterium]